LPVNKQDYFDLELPDSGATISNDMSSGFDDDLDFEFDFDNKEEEDEIEEFSGNFEVVNEDDEAEEEVHSNYEQQISENDRRQQLIQARKEREEKLASLKGSRTEFSHEAFKEKWDTPAYERKQVNFQKVPASTDRNISKFNLTDDNHIVGNNRWLHDNVD
jgi:cell division protein FtsZ